MMFGRAVPGRSRYGATDAMEALAAHRPRAATTGGHRVARRRRPHPRMAGIDPTPYAVAGRDLRFLHAEPA
jgi:hypothetical protein